MKVCVMNCGQSTGDKRTRANIMLTCGDCVDMPDKVLHHVAIAIDTWKRSTFEMALESAGFVYVITKGVSDNTLLINVKTAEVQKLADVTRSTNAQCAIQKSWGIK